MAWIVLAILSVRPVPVPLADRSCSGTGNSSIPAVSHRVAAALLALLTLSGLVDGGRNCCCVSLCLPECGLPRGLMPRLQPRLPRTRELAVLLPILQPLPPLAVHS